MFSMLLSHFDSRMFMEAAEFFKMSLGLDKQDIPINVSMVDNIGKGDVGGCCGPEMTKDSTYRDMKISVINIKIKNTVTILGMIEALAHEMVHAFQFIRGDLVIKLERCYILWVIPDLKVLRFWKGEDITDLTYHQRPSEVEAFLLQKQMTYYYLKSIEKNLDPLVMASLLDIK